MADFKPVTNGFRFASEALYTLEATISESQKVEAEHVDLIGQKTSDANNQMIKADEDWMKHMPGESHKDDKDYSEQVQKWQTQYNLINTRGQMIVNKLQAETQNDGTNLQAIGNALQNAIQVQTAFLSPLQTVTSLLQSPV